MRRPALEYRDVTLAASGGALVRDFYLAAYEGEYIAVMGADGSGKDALGLALYGEAACRSGEIWLAGEPFVPEGIPQAHRRKVFLISKESNFIDSQSIAENIFLNHGGLNRLMPASDRLILSETGAILKKFGLHIDPRTPAGDFSPAMKCVLEMIKWHTHGARVLVLLGALAVPSAAERAQFLKVLGTLRESGAAVLHLMNRCLDVFAEADRCVLLSPQGRVARTLFREEFRMDAINEYIGRCEITAPARIAPKASNEEIFRAENISAGKCRGVSFSLRRGEVLGLYCKGGEDYDAVAYALCGTRAYTGSFYLNGRRVRIQSAADALKLGIGLLPSDPMLLYYPDLTPWENAAMPFLRRVGNRLGVLQNGKMRALMQDVERCLGQLEEAFDQADGEEHMFCVLSRFFLYPYRILVLPHPGAVNDVRKENMVHHLIDVAVGRGCSLVVVSTRLVELEPLCSAIHTLE